MKFWALVMPFALFFNGITFAFSGSQPHKATLNYAFSNEESGSAAGTIEVKAEKDGDYYVFWGDEDYKILSEKVGKYTAKYSEIAEINVKNGEGKATVTEFTTIPEGAETMLIYKGKNLFGVENIPENKQVDEEEALYTFGSLSDVHFNRYDRSGTDDACLEFTNALNFLDLMGVKLVAMPGDLSKSAELDSYQKYNTIISKYKFPVYTCTGNHDVKVGHDWEIWKSLVNPGVASNTLPDGVVNVADNKIDFVYAPSFLNGDAFIFLSQMCPTYDNVTPLLGDDQLDWLGKQLEVYKDHTVYLFFHTFLADNTGNIQMGVGNFVNAGGQYYELVYGYGMKDEVRMRNYLQQYKNVVFFNGHSHWSFEMQKYNPKLNISDYDGTYATIVHVPSVSSPRSVLSDDAPKCTTHSMEISEGYFISVYDDRIVLTGIDFWKGQFLSYATYEIDR